ncbi:hypothetical protein [Streptomyces sp. NBC_01497]|uniref:hypothetical protein n=1 Tax=Streptomyces sp. NBC_01497 TaxID=2903885 RepID=UPI002E3795AB|nr:hypothetical protein [Streptomyces sp. NBC_01497]
MRVRHRGTAALTTAVLIAAGFTAAQRAQTPERPEASAPGRGTGPGRAAEPVHPRGAAALTGPAPGGPAGRGARAGDRDDRAACTTRVTGSHAVADCHNPDPATDRVRLHVECARWWDIDADSAPVDVPPAGYARLTERCWKEIASVWISHEPVPHAPAGHAPPGTAPLTRAPVRTPAGGS